MLNLLVYLFILITYRSRQTATRTGNRCRICSAKLSKIRHPHNIPRTKNDSTRQANHHSYQPLNAQSTITLIVTTTLSSTKPANIQPIKSAIRQLADNKNEIHGATIVTPLGTANKKAGRKTPCVSRPALGKIALPFIEKNSYEPQDLELSYIFVICRPPQRLP